jgi:polyisoprenoid-binding protein YceI
MNRFLLTCICLISLCCTTTGLAWQDPSAPVAVPIQSIVVLGPENSRVEFVGTHVGDDPKPRLGGFKNFRGLIVVDSPAKKLQSLELSFDIGSIWTEFDNLTSHLMKADFFEQESFPQAIFRSTQIASLSEGRCNIKGELTLHGQTAEISFPASFQVTPDGLTLNSEFILDRTRFGMDKMTDGVEKEVSIAFTAGVPDRSLIEGKENADSLKPQPVLFRKSILLSPQNSSVEFIGTHVGAKPDPRLGGFGKFKGILLMDESGSAPESLGLEFEIDSIWTEFDKLTNHLLTADFFDRERFPTATFRSTRIVKSGDQPYSVEGELTLLGTTAPLEFPATIRINDQGVELESEFALDRTKFGMSKMTEGVKSEVIIRFFVGKPDRNAKKLNEAQSSQSSKAKSSSSMMVKIFLPKMLQY